MRRIIGALILVLGFSGMVAAQDIRLPLEQGKPDLALFVLDREEAQISESGWQLLRIQGFLHRPRAAALQPLSSGHSLVPTLRHDPNVNDGIPSDHITLGGLRFHVDESSRAKGALLPGLLYTRWTNYSYAPGARLRVAQSYALEPEPVHGYHQAAASAHICVEQPVADWTWLDACLSARAAYDGIGMEYSLDSRLSARRIFDTVFGAQQTRFTIGQLTTDDYDKAVLRFDTTLLTRHRGMWTLGMAWGERVAGENTLRQSISLEWSGTILERDVTLGLSEIRTDGGAFFGIAREDRRTRLSAIVPIRKLDIGAYIERKRSTIDAYRGMSFGMDVRFRMNLL